MILLNIDTSTNILSLAVSKDGKKVASTNKEMKRSLSSKLIPEIDRLLTKTGLTLKEINGINIGLGPGSFTSLRIGLATVKGLAFAQSIPVVGISSLDAIAMSVKEDGSICVLVDAKRSKVYAARYTKKGQTIKRESDIILDDIKNVLPGIPKETIFVGDGSELYQSEIRKKLSSAKILSDKRKNTPQAQYFPLLTVKKWKNKRGDNIARLVPEYLYPEDCQVR